jgi:hypothetical protein
VNRPDRPSERRVEAVVRFAFTVADCADEDTFTSRAADRACAIAATLETFGLATIEDVTLR